LERSDTDYLKYYSNNRYEEMTKPRRHLNWNRRFSYRKTASVLPTTEDNEIIVIINCKV
jgi:hypothetical protein